MAWGPATRLLLDGKQHDKLAAFRTEQYFSILWALEGVPGPFTFP